MGTQRAMISIEDLLDIQLKKMKEESVLHWHDLVLSTLLDCCCGIKIYDSIHISLKYLWTSKTGSGLLIIQSIYVALGKHYISSRELYGLYLLKIIFTLW